MADVVVQVAHRDLRLQFSVRSHGFRPGRSCHTTLDEIATAWTGTTRTRITLGRGSPHRLNALDLGPIRTRRARWSNEQPREELTEILARWIRLLTAPAAGRLRSVQHPVGADPAHQLDRQVGQDDASRVTS
ncbi:hypothetical protein ACQPZQ_15700 [Pseudonocardia sp. CA-142604]|uniref:hypothetical protein n=1 Tax=Pseudonocardia sp. CA-142604 TaxID=3240024 RepID=UPI003D9011D3